MATKIPAILRIRRGTEEQWNSSNPILAEGEVGYITSGDNTGQLKVGDGINTWNNIPFTVGLIHWGKILGVLGNQADLQNEFDKTNALIVDLETIVNGWIGRGGYLEPFDFGTDTPTQEALTNEALAQITTITDGTQIFNGTKIKNLFDNHYWILTNTQDTDPVIFEWTDQGLGDLSQFAEDMGGYIVGASESDGIGYVRADPDGKGKVTGLVEMNSLLTMGPPNNSSKEAVVSGTSGNNNNLTWIADRNGYVEVTATASGSGSARIVISINNNIFILSSQENNLFLYASNTLYEVIKGDIVTASIQGTYKWATNPVINFISPVINPPAFLETMPLLDYSTVEQDTGRKWIDGKEIYQRTNGEEPPAANLIQSVTHPAGGTTYWYTK